MTFEELVTVIRSSFEAADGQVEADIAAHLERLEKMGLVKGSARPA